MARRMAGAACVRSARRQDLADRVRGRAPALARLAFRDRGGEEQARPGQHAHEHLQENQALMHLGAGKRPRATNGMPDRHRRGGEHDERGRRLSQSHRRGNDERKNDVLERMLSEGWTNA